MSLKESSSGFPSGVKSGSDGGPDKTHQLHQHQFVRAYGVKSPRPMQMTRFSTKPGTFLGNAIASTLASRIDR